MAAFLSLLTCRRAAAWAGVAVVAAVLAVAPPTASAAPPVDRPRDGDLWRDVRLTCDARRALHQDWVLARFNLGVTVRSGVATLWGPVTTETLVRRASERVSEVPGVFQVRNEMWVDPNWDPPAEPAETPPSPSLSDPPSLPRFPAALAGQTKRPGAAAGKTLSGPPKPFPGDNQTLRPPLLEITLPPPLAILGAPVAPQPPELPPADPPPQKQDLASLLAQLQQDDPRRADIRVQVQDGIVYLQSVGAASEVVYTFADAINHLPGVKQVIIQAPR